MNSLPEAPLKLKDQTTMKETMKANLTAPVPSEDLPPALSEDTRREGFHDPIYCPRGRGDCRALAQIISTGHVSFVCCGENDRQLITVPTDHYRFCHKTAEGVDVLMNLDQRDMSHIAAVCGWALGAVIAPSAGHECSDSPINNERMR